MDRGDRGHLTLFWCNIITPRGVAWQVTCLAKTFFRIDYVNGGVDIKDLMLDHVVKFEKELADAGV